MPTPSAAGADIVCTCTTSDTPVFPGTLLALGAHVNAVGSYRADARELDDDVMRRAALVVVEDGDFHHASNSGDAINAEVSPLRPTSTGAPVSTGPNPLGMNGL